MRALLLPALIAALALGLIACQKSEGITVDNKTSRTVVVYEDGEPSELIGAGASQTFDVGSFRGTLKYEVRYLCEDTSCDQTVLVSRTFTWDDIKQAGGVTITVGNAVSD
ncbi:MAG TPA: hypothetical protein VLS25_04530 [Dehalococcoidia bacterium]|nr:hypothetical protein [Dehalococcoidia bacterium]